MLRYIFIISIAIFLLPVSARAFEVPYQKVFQQRGATVSVSIYGEADPHYAQCDLDQWTCANQGTSTPNLFPEYSGKEFALSKDQKFALVSEGSGISRSYDLYTLGAGTSTKITIDFTGETRKVLFSDDDTKILFTTKLGEFVIFDIKTNSAIKSIPIVGEASFIRFSPRGNYIAYYSPNTMSGKERGYTLVDIVRDHTYTWKEKNDYWDLLSEEEKIFDFSPDERQFLYLSDRDGTQTLYVARLGPLDGVHGRLGKRMFKTNFTVNNFLFGNDGLLYFTANRKNPLIWSLYSYNFGDQLVRGISDDVLYYPPPYQAGKYVLFLRSKDALPVLYALNTEIGTIEVLPVVPNVSFPIAAGKIRNFAGRYGVLYTPDNYDKKKAYPLIVWLHGGPHRQTSPSFHSYHSYGTYDGMLEYLRKNGFVVFKLDYRGSYGYGKKFATDLKGNVGNLDVKDVVDATAALKKEMKIGEVYPMGTSYGGYLALRALSGKPKLFAGAISVNGVTDWWTLIKNDPSSIFKVHFNGSPSAKNRILYDRASIFSRLNNLSGKKIVLVQGEEDDTVPHQQTTMLYDALIAKGMEPTIISYKNEGHILGDSANIDDLCNHVVKLPAGYADRMCVQ